MLVKKKLDQSPHGYRSFYLCAIACRILTTRYSA